MPWYVFIAFRHLFPQGRWFSLFALVSVVGTTLGVALLHVVIAVFNGFGYEIRNNIAEVYGDIRIETRGIFYDYKPLVEELENDPTIVAVSPYAYGMVMAQYKNRPIVPAINGIDLRSKYDIASMNEYLQVGSIDDLDDDSVFISSGVAASLGILYGSEIDIYTPLMLDKLQKDELLLPRTVRVAGVFHTGWNEADSNSFICTLRLMQDLYGLGEGVHGLKIRVSREFDEIQKARELSDQLGSQYGVLTWMDSQNEFLAVLDFEKRMMFFLLSIIILVASFSIIAPLLISVVRKTREIGLLASMGATSFQISMCFCLQALFLGVVGVTSGFLMGALALYNRDAIIVFFAKVTGAGDSISSVYAFSFLPAKVQTGDMVVIASLAIVLSFLAGLIPAYKAGRMKPVDALRSE